MALRCADVIGPNDQEQLNCLISVLVDMACSTSLANPLTGSASKTTTFERPGAMEIAISMSRATSLLPLFAPVVGTPLNPSSRTICRGTFVTPVWLSYDAMSPG